MDLSLQPIAADHGAMAILNYVNHDGASGAGFLLPQELRDVLGAANTAHLPAVHMHFRVGKLGYHCRTFLMQADMEVTSLTMLALHFQRDSSARDAIEYVTAQYHLTDRERQALEGIASGLTSKEMAAQMNISPNTVKSFLRIIMLKMGVATRSGLVGKLLRYSTSSNHNDGRS